MRCRTEVSQLSTKRMNRIGSFPVPQSIQDETRDENGFCHEQDGGLLAQTQHLCNGRIQNHGNGTENGHTQHREQQIAFRDADDYRHSNTVDETVQWTELSFGPRFQRKWIQVQSVG